jgi:hypothetical protein
MHLDAPAMFGQSVQTNALQGLYIGFRLTLGRELELSTLNGQGNRI